MAQGQGLTVTDLELWRPKVAAWAAKRCPDPDDIASEAIFRCWLALEQGKTIHRGFAFVIASHLIIDGYRQHRWGGQIPIEKRTPFLNDPRAEGGFRETEAVLDAEQVITQAHLTDLQRAVLLLSAEGCHQQEIADRLNVSINAVKKLKERGLTQVRRTVS